jgi:hypothetical protein
MHKAMSGWIKIHRQIRNHWVFKNANYFKAWVVIISEVNHQSTKVVIEGELIECKRGQSINSLATWVKILGDEWTVQKIRTFFKLLEKDGMINTEGLRKTTRLTVCNYESYQSEQQGDNKQTTNRQQTDNKEITTNKNVKNVNNNIPSVEEFVAYGVSLIEDVSIEALKLKHQSWLVNNWCKEKNGKLIKIVNWKSTLSNTISYLPKQPKQLAKSEDQIRYEHVMKQMELNK